jgi:hypothetical protein
MHFSRSHDSYCTYDAENGKTQHPLGAAEFGISKAIQRLQLTYRLLVAELENVYRRLLNVYK